MSRKNAREDTFKLIFEDLINKGEPDEKLCAYFDKVNSKETGEDPLFINKPSKNDNDYVKEVVCGIFQKSEELNDIIKANLRNWELSRVSKVSIALVRLALYEIIYLDDVPVNVAINEAVELAKKYDGRDAASFVNGVLGSYARGLEE